MGIAGPLPERNMTRGAVSVTTIDVQSVMPPEVFTRNWAAGTDIS
jgi:hypothetical protein